MGASDEFVRQREFDMLNRTVEDLRTQVRANAERAAELREADNRSHATAHDAIESRIEGEFKDHELEHEREKTAAAQAAQAAEKKGDNRWSRTLAVLTLAAGVVGLYIEVILAHKG